jgi:hypothetical protein|tara:strand:+ start:32 stop:1585 length:1554 start_codon:yes stop_codon:yes gene_type:complete
MNQALKQQVIPAGGIADFVMSDEQIEQLEAEELREQFGTNGIAQFSEVGKKMANFGRYGDDTVAHVETGELIVPRALIEKNPALKESIFSHLRELGVEDPERYVVGESKNSLNPTTGLPEFFFKKLFKSVSKIAKGVGKALKKAAPLIIPMALNYFAPGLGQVYSAALGAGIGTLVQGGSIKDAFKSALVGGATGAISAGFSGPNSGIEGFGQNIAADVNMGTTNIGNAFSQGSFAPLKSTAIPSIRDLVSGETPVSGDGIQKASFSTSGVKEPAFIDMTKPTGEAIPLDSSMKPIIQTNVPPKPTSMFDTLKEYGSKASDYLFRGGETEASILQAQDLAQQKYLANAKQLGITPTQAGIDAARKAAGPSFLTKYGPSAALLTAAGAAGGMFDVPEQEDLGPTRTGMDVYEEDPDKYNVADLDPIYADGNPRISSRYPYYVPQAVAEGGEIFPRRVGGIMPDEGIPNKDSVRAMLMPGEFVMTTDAVKGLGGGDMNKGISNMYNVMRNLEQRGRAMA